MCLDPAEYMHDRSTGCRAWEEWMSARYALKAWLHIEKCCRGCRKEKQSLPLGHGSLPEERAQV